MYALPKYAFKWMFDLSAIVLLSLYTKRIFACPTFLFVVRIRNREENKYVIDSSSHLDRKTLIMHPEHRSL